MKHALFPVALLALAGCILPPSRIAVRGVPNFHRVNAGLYRSASRMRPESRRSPPKT